MAARRTPNYARVKVSGTVGKRVTFGPSGGATAGAQIGLNLALPDGSVPSLAQLAAALDATVTASTGTSFPAAGATIDWKLITGVPPLVERLGVSGQWYPPAEDQDEEPNYPVPGPTGAPGLQGLTGSPGSDSDDPDPPLVIPGPAGAKGLPGAPIVLYPDDPDDPPPIVPGQIGPAGPTGPTGPIGLSAAWARPDAEDAEDWSAFNRDISGSADNNVWTGMNLYLPGNLKVGGWAVAPPMAWSAFQDYDFDDLAERPINECMDMNYPYVFTGNLTFSPGAGTPITVNGVSGQPCITVNVASGSTASAFRMLAPSGTAATFVVAGDGLAAANGLTVQQTATGVAVINQGNAANLNIQIGGTSAILISSSRNITIPAPASGDCLALAAVAGGNALTATGSAAGTPTLHFVTMATTGTQTATFTATNKPGSGTTAPTKWLPVNLDGTTYYIPCWQ